MIISTREAYLGKRPLKQNTPGDIIIPLSLDNETVNPAIPLIENNEIGKRDDGVYFQFTYGIWFWVAGNKAETSKSDRRNFGIDDQSYDLFYIPALNAVVWFRDVVPDELEREAIAQKLIYAGMDELLKGTTILE